jgi:hypothetical protein
MRGRDSLQHPLLRFIGGPERAFDAGRLCTGSITRFQKPEATQVGVVHGALEVHHDGHQHIVSENQESLLDGPGGRRGDEDRLAGDVRCHPSCMPQTLLEVFHRIRRDRSRAGRLPFWETRRGGDKARHPQLGEAQNPPTSTFTVVRSGQSDRQVAQTAQR